MGNRSPNNAPRNTYRTADDRWVAISASTFSVVERVMGVIGREDLLDEPWFATSRGRAEHVEVIDAAVGGWTARYSEDEVIAAFEAAGAAVAPIYDIQRTIDDPQYQARESFIALEDDELGEVLMTNVMFRMSETPGSIRFPGRRLGQDNEAVLGAIGVGPAELERLRDSGVV
jgi:crotonobetainyl-CoA:carnitine CoA-transferase CaiB-like acyl-CoA transferase